MIGIHAGTTRVNRRCATPHSRATRRRKPPSGERANSPSTRARMMTRCKRRRRRNE
jgi:hypothetical protein